MYLRTAAKFVTLCVFPRKLIILYYFFRFCFHCKYTPIIVKTSVKKERIVSTTIISLFLPLTAKQGYCTIFSIKIQQDSLHFRRIHAKSGQDSCPLPIALFAADFPEPFQLFLHYRYFPERLSRTAFTGNFIHFREPHHIPQKCSGKFLIKLHCLDIVLAQE